jgi:hypothetical protein
VDVVEWSRALNVRLSECWCSVSMVWVRISSRNKYLTPLKSNSNTVWFNFQTYIYIYLFGKLSLYIGGNHQRGTKWFRPELSIFIKYM